MNKHLKYLSYVLRHKWYVLVECWKYGLYWQGISHDMSKFLPREWFPYVERFYGSNETVRDKTGYYDPTINEEFAKAWFWHQKCNKHHWQYWIQPKDNGELKCMEIPFKYCLEMVCDWAGAGRAQGFSEPVSWYRANKDKLILHENSRLLIENCLWEFFGDG